MIYLSHRGRIIFLQMKRQGGMNEKSYRNQYDKPFDWLTFNAQ